MACCYPFWVNGLKGIPPVARQPSFKISPPQAPVIKSIDSYQFPLWTCPSLCPTGLGVGVEEEEALSQVRARGPPRPLSTYTKSPSLSRNLHCNCFLQSGMCGDTLVSHGRDHRAKTRQSGISETSLHLLSTLKAKHASPATPSSN